MGATWICSVKVRLAWLLLLMATTGAWVSRVTVIETVPVLPAASVAMRVIVFAPSTVRFWEVCVV